DVFDVPGLVELMGDIRSRAVRVVDIESSQPSPFAKSLVFGYVAQYLYEGDSPLAERRAAALALDPSLLSELLGQGEALALRDLLDPEAVARTEAELQRLTPERGARDAEDVADLLRVLGPLSVGDVVARAAEGFEPAAVEAALTQLEASRRVIPVRVGGQARWAAIEDAARLRDALGTSLPVGVPQAFLESVPDPLADLVARFARTHGPFAVQTVATWWGLGPAVVHDALRRLVSAGRVVEGELLPTENGGGHGPEFCDAEVLRLLRRRSLAALRHEVEPVAQADLARFLPQWQGVGGGLRGREGLLRAVEQLTGAVLPASALESLVLPARVADYRPALLDEVMSAGEVTWRGHGSLPGDDGWISLHLADAAHLTLTPPEVVELTDAEQATLEALEGGGAYFFRALATRVGLGDSELGDALWSLVWSGRATNDTMAPLRALLAGGRTAHKRTTTGPRSTRYAGRRGSLGRFGSLRGPVAGTTTAQVESAEDAAAIKAAAAGRSAGSGPSTGVGRWTALPIAESDPTVRAVTNAELLLDRYGVLTRGSVVTEDVPGGFAAVYRVLAAAEEAGKVRRGYFVEGLGASQFASTGAVDRLRSMSRLLSGDAPSAADRDGALEGAPGAGPGMGPDDDGEAPWSSTVGMNGRGSPGGPGGMGGGAGGYGGPGRGGHPGRAAWGAGARKEPTGPPALVLAASDPANPYGAAIGWPERGLTDATDESSPAEPASVAGTTAGTTPGTAAGTTTAGARSTSRRKGHQPGRKAGALVVLVDGELVLYVERGGKTMLCWSEKAEPLQAAADALALAVREGALGRLTVEKADGASLLGSGHPLVEALSQAGFHMTPKGLRLRR
ncbi:MAG: dependent helicase, Lhr family, partial [Humibacillus sp.]|nr:dependent helicase, Lhr family [Humibacillus sp.]